MDRKWFVLVAFAGLARLAAADTPSGQEILRKAAEAARGLDAITYEAEFRSEGEVASLLPAVAGRITLARSQSGLPKVSAETWLMADDGSAIPKATVVSDGHTLAAAFHDRKTFQQRKAGEAGSLLLPWSGLFLWDAVSKQPYRQELSTDAVRYLGTEKVGEVECDVVAVTLSEGNAEVRWSFAKSDYLPRRMERVVSDAVEGGGGRVTLTIYDVTPNPTVSDDMFRFEAPAGYLPRDASSLSHDVQPAPPRPWEPAVLLPPGALAPEFSLKDADGKVVSLKDLRGKIVILDFWATWCRPCMQALRRMQKLNDYYKGKPVAVYGVNTFERGGDAAKVMKAGGFTYGHLLGGDAIAPAYRVRGVPTVYVIGPDGKVLYAESGGFVGQENQIRDVVDRALREMEEK